MAQFLTAVALDLTKVTCWQTISAFVIVFFLIDLAWLGSIDSGGRGGAFWLPLSLIMSAAVFFLIPPSLSRGLGVVKAGRSCQNRQLWAPDLRFFRLGVLCYLGLRVGLGRGAVHRSIALVVVLIGVAADGGLYFGFGLSLCGFLNQTAPTVQLSAFFIDPQPNQWPQIFVKALAQNFFG